MLSSSSAEGGEGLGLCNGIPLVYQVNQGRTLGIPFICAIRHLQLLSALYWSPSFSAELDS
jgi:hypothetical protein